MTAISHLPILSVTNKRLSLALLLFQSASFAPARKTNPTKANGRKKQLHNLDKAQAIKCHENAD